MPICQSCGNQWSWKQTFRKMFTLDVSIECPYCKKKQYQTRTSRKRAAYMTLLILLPLILPIAPEIKLIILFSFFVICTIGFPYMIQLSNEEEHMF
ncbi:hypothetical protein CEY16_13330 [Halalkalibacillus sediminis]|uniref:Cxxc_20_cxxc protein n=1 Tax=Halalkalibacillus sediminis TaxID=2018042 RepID=A0A2I0QR37_9BACI|nr:TIGR04104 family putative zinc finger protein [Halalkalibacillus sediminis]PKR76796.1 hypothetical protein CEY16_13330 [Halalkalibacillus sediminis]